jgi:hypothetical protein
MAFREIAELDRQRRQEMGSARKAWLAVLAIVLGASCLVGVSGCGYAKNVGDDFRDIFILGAGVTPPVLSTEQGVKVAGLLPPSIGLYVQATDFIHFGGLIKSSTDLEWDRRGYGMVADRRAKAGFLFWHWERKQQDPIYVNAYKATGNELDPWREFMRSAKDPLFKTSAKELIYDRSAAGAEPYLSRGWQGWETFEVEIALPEPCLLHTGLNFRFGVDLSEVFDFALSLVGLDIYGDAAYECLSGAPIHKGPKAAGEKSASMPKPGLTDPMFK